MGILLCLLAILIPFDYCYVNWFRHFSLTLIPDGLLLPVWFEKRIFFHITDIIAVVVFFMAPKKINPWLVGLVALSFLSIALSPFYNYPVAYMRLLQLITPILLFSAASEKWAKPVLWCLCLGGLFQAVIGIAQYFHQEPLGLFMLGELRHGPHAGEIPSPTGARWIFDAISSKTDLRRASGTMAHSNPLGGFLVVSLFSAFALFKEKQKLMSLVIPIMIFALVLTFSRSAFCGGVLGALVYFYKVRPPKLLAAVLAVSLSLSCVLVGEQISNRFSLNEGADAVRLSQNRVAFDMIKAHPIFGVGYQQFRTTPEFNDVKGKESITMVHNSPLLIAAEMGLPALFCALGFIVVMFKRGWQSTGEAAAAGLAALIAFGWICNCDFYPFYFQSAKMTLFLILAMGIPKRATEPLLPGGGAPIVVVPGIVPVEGSKLSLLNRQLKRLLRLRA